MVWVVLVQVWNHLWCLEVWIAHKLVIWRLWIVLEVADEVTTWSLWIVACILALGLFKVVWRMRAEDREALGLIGEGIWKFLSHLEWFPWTWIVLEGLSMTQVVLELSRSRVLGPNVVTFKSTYT